jgi:hypothetical protein
VWKVNAGPRRSSAAMRHQHRRAVDALDDDAHRVERHVGAAQLVGDGLG